MGTNSKPRRKKGMRENYKWLGHIEVGFNDEERERAIEYCDGRELDFEDVISRITQTKTGIKFSYSESNDTYRATVQPKDKGNTYYGYTIGFAHLDLARLLSIVQYIIVELMENAAIPIPEDREANDW